MTQCVAGLRSRSRAALLLLCSTGLLPTAAPSAAFAAEGEEAGARLEPAIVSAAGRQVSELEVAAFGRYAISVTSARGTALQVVDRMTGAGAISGETGKIDGRQDLFLDRGAVRLVTYGSKLATGNAELHAAPFREREAGAAPVALVEGRPIDGELADLEQISWWLEVPKRRRVVFEAAGRSLADLRLWQSGSWLVDAEPLVSTIEPQSGRPLTLCQLTAELEPGIYRLTAYGGPDRAWPAGGSERPLHLRFGWGRDPQTLRERRTIGALGFDRVVVSGAADYVRIELPEAPAGNEQVELSVADYDETDPFSGYGWSGAITRENLPPEIEWSGDTDAERSRLVTVRGRPGQSYVLQHFPRTRQRELNARAVQSKYWISTVHSGPLADAIEPTALLVRAGDGAKRKSEVVAAETVVLSPVAGWARRFNLLEPATLYVKVETAATYRVTSHGVAAQMRFEPLFLDAYPTGWQQPPMRVAPAEWDLSPGYYVLFLQPIEAGIVELAISAKGGEEATVEPTRPNVQLGVQALNAKFGYRLYLSDQPGIAAGMVVRELPLDLEAALTLALGPGEEVLLPVRARVRSAVRALTETGESLEISVDGASWAAQAVGAPGSFVEAGEHALRVRSTADRTVLASVGFVAESQLASRPLPPLPQAALDALPAFPRLEAGAPQYFDLAASESRTFLMAADEPALYRVESTGLLATGGAVRTRTRSNLLSTAENGVGRNFALAAYLGEGDYQLTVRPRGASAGHLGLAMSQAPVVDGGALADGIPARTTLEPGGAVSYRLEVPTPGRYRIAAQGLRQEFAVRLEDAAGWPVAAPIATTAFDIDLDAGSYRLIVLPQEVEARAVVLAERSVEVAETVGHGPHALPLGAERGHVWLEPEAGAPRDPDRWRFRLPAATGVTIRLSDEMMGVVRPLGTEAPLPDGGLVPPGRPYRAELPAGEYELAAESSRSNNRLRYRVAVETDDLVAGRRIAVAAPAEIWLAVGEGAQVELASYGSDDVRATLKSALGEPIAAADDRPGDWNFLLSERLAPGRYRLQVDPVGTATARVEVGMRELEERAYEAIALGASPVRTEIQVGDEALVVPLARDRGAELLAVGARSAESLGLALEERITGANSSRGEGSWRVLTTASGRAESLALALAESTGELRLRLWSLDRRPASVTLTMAAGPAVHRDESDLEHGIELPPVAGIDPPVAAAIVDLTEPGCFRRSALESGPEILQALAAGSVFERAAPTLAPVGLTMPLAATPAAGETARVLARRARVGEGEELSLLLPARTPVTCDVKDGGAAVVELQAMAGDPVVSFLDGRAEVGPGSAWPFASRGLARTAAAPGKGRAVELWNAGTVSVEARLGGWIAKSGESQSLGWGAASATAAPSQAVAVALPAGRKALRLTLAAGTTALLLAPPQPDPSDDAEAVVWAAGGATSESLMTAAERLILFGGSDAAGELGIEMLPEASAGASAVLGESGRFERRYLVRGGSRLEVGVGAGARRLHLRGASTALFAGEDGSLQRGSDFEVPPGGGSLRFEHGPGLVSVWIDSLDAAPADRGSASPGLQPALPATIALSAPSHDFEFRVDTPSLLELRSTAPGAVSVVAPEGRAEVYPLGVNFDTVVPAGATRVVVRGLAGESLTGRLTAVAVPLVPLAEGLGEPVLLAPGESRGYRFRVARPGPIGVGVQADEGGVETMLMTAGGRLLGRGVVQWIDCTPGEYVVVVNAPLAGRPARVRPALVGTAPPGNGPPPEEARRFLALAAGERPAVVGIEGAEDLSHDWLGVRDRDAEDGGDDAYAEEESGDEGEWIEESESGDDSEEVE